MSDTENDQDRRARENEEEMERLLLEQEQDDHHDDHDDDDAPPQPDAEEEEPAQARPPLAPPRRSIPYTQASFVAAVAALMYALRTRQQWYLALVYLSSSKWAYIVLGNAIIAGCVSTFHLLVNLYLKGLRPAEAEGLGDFFRWNVTETCLALTMFRSEINVKTGVLFLVLVLAKCLHWVAETRRGHFQMTQEAVVTIETGVWTGWPFVQRPWLGIVCFLETLLVLDVICVAHCAHDMVQHGATVALFFGFEAAILFVAAMSNLLLAGIHFCDGMIHWAHEGSADKEKWHKWAHSVLHMWKDHKATLTFAIEVQAQGAKFLFYVIFFGIVLTYYGMPINLIREVYMSFQNLRQRLMAFAKYRQLMQSMNRYESLQSEQELEEAGKVCIICRDAMTLVDCKKLPGCGHVFHKSCLREWLVHQQTCPTCRGDIAVSDARLRAAAAREQQAEQQQQQQQEQAAAAPPPQVAPGAAAAPPPQVAPGAATVPTAPHEDAPVSEQMEKRLDKMRDMPSAAATTSAFPCLYRVLSMQGAVVWNRVDGGTWTKNRIVPVGTIVLCTSIEWATRGDWSGMMLQIPDGWVSEADLERIAIQLPKQPMKQQFPVAAS